MDKKQLSKGNFLSRRPAKTATAELTGTQIKDKETMKVPKTEMAVGWIEEPEKAQVIERVPSPNSAEVA